MAEEVSAKNKRVLACVGERKREIVFPAADNPADELKSLLQSIQAAYCDVDGIKFGEDMVLQVKSEAWGGEFIDVNKRYGGG